MVVAGAAGFIGSHLCERLVAVGAVVVGVDDLSTGSKANVASLNGHARFAFERRDVALLRDIDGPVDAIMHLASPAAPGDYLARPVQTLSAGSVGTLNLAGLAERKGAKLLLASTSEVYGDPLQHPQRETYWGNVNPIGPRSVYDEAKRFAEAVVAQYGRMGVPVAIARIFNTYGPRMSTNDSRAVPTFVGQACAGRPLTVAGDGSQTRSLCFVDDTVTGLLQLLLADVGNPVNLGSTHEITVLELAKLIRHLCGSQSPVEFVSLPQDDPQRRRPDTSRGGGTAGLEPGGRFAGGPAPHDRLVPARRCGAASVAGGVR
ncbi:NAD-dependent epimerase/dehydratase family protein [Yinghuangia aomiensis]